MASPKEHLLKAIEFEPDFPDARYQLARMYAKDDEIPEAIDQLETLLLSHPDHLEARDFLAELHLQHAQYDRAKKHLESILENDPRNPTAHLQLAKAALETNQPHDAIYHFEKVLQQDPDQIEAYFQLGLLHNSPEDFAKARSYFETTIDFDPSHAEGHYQLGMLLCHGYHYDHTGSLLQGGYDEDARKLFKETLKLKPDHPQALAELGLLEADFEEVSATKTLKSALQLDPTRVDVWLKLAQISEGKETLETLDKALEHHPENPALHLQLAQESLKLKRIEAAIGHFQRTIHTALRQFTLLKEKANEHLSQNQFFEARRIEEEIHEFSNHRAEAHYQIARINQKNEEWEKARTHLEEGIRANPHHWGILHQIAIDEARSGNDELAIEHLRKSVEIEIQNPDAHYLLGQLLEKKGDIQMSQNHYLITLDLDPNHAEAQSRIIPT
jgi:tetratricopeptide (TPR) repeat protein